MEKEIEELKNIVAIHFGALGFLNPSENEQILKDRDKVLNALTTKSKKEQAFEIIKEKNVNIGLVSVLGSVEQYNQTYVYDNMLNVKWCLTQKEYDLLKEILVNEV